MPHRAAPQHLAALVCYAVLTVLLTWPVLGDLTRVAPNDLGDPLLSTFILWWNAQVVPFTERWWHAPFYFPGSDTLAYSDHRVGIGLVTTPAIRFGMGALAAHNLAFVLTFFLSAAGAYALGVVLTGSRVAAFIGGLVFGFNPYRADHLPHLELLASYWLPIVLIGLHLWIATRRLRWLALTALALVMLALTSGYYFVFAGPLLALWMAWFMRGRLPLAVYGWTVAAVGLSAAAVAPVFLRYREAHDALDLRRSLAEIEYYSADLVALVTAPDRLSLWNTPASWYRPEGALFPGAAVILLVALALWRRRSQDARALSRWARRARAAALAAAVAMAGAALLPLVFGPIAREVAGLRISISDSHKPISVAVVFFTVWCLSTDAVRGAWHRRSPLAFYVLATLVMWLFALGPAPKLFGHLILYKPPYAWLMELPGFGGGLRVPARFGMLAALTLSAAGALAFERLLRHRPRHAGITGAVLAVVIVAESWFTLPAPAAPPPLIVPAEVPAAAAILEVPVDITTDAAAMYRAIAHGRPVVNGMSGYDAPHYGILRSAWLEGHLDAFQPLARFGPIALFVPRHLASADLIGRLEASLVTTKLPATATHEVFLLPQSSAPAAGPPAASSLPITALSDASSNHDDLRNLVDDDRESVWMTDDAQAGSESVTADLGMPAAISGVRLRQGVARLQYPRELAIDVSSDGIAWLEVARLAPARTMVEATLRDPRDPVIEQTFAATMARYVRVKQIGRSRLPWAMSKLEVLGER